MVQKSQKMLNALGSLVFMLSLFFRNLNNISKRATVNRIPIKNWLFRCMFN